MKPWVLDKNSQKVDWKFADLIFREFQNPIPFNSCGKTICKTSSGFGVIANVATVGNRDVVTCQWVTSKTPNDQLKG